MSGAKTRSGFVIAILAAMVLPCAGISRMYAQMQQTGTQDSTRTTSSSADPTAYSSAPNPDATSSDAANPGGGSGGASSWTTGKDSFGITARTPGGSFAGANGGNWAAGSGSFGMKGQPGGIWRETGGGSMGAPNTATAESAAAKSLVPEELPGWSADIPATAGSPRGGQSNRIPVSRSPAGARPVSGARFAASNGFRSGGNRSVASKAPSLGGHRAAGTKNHAGPPHGFAPSSSHPKTKPPSEFGPSGSSTMGGMHQADTGREPIP